MLYLKHQTWLACQIGVSPLSANGQILCSGGDKKVEMFLKFPGEYQWKDKEMPVTEGQFV